ncbi:recombination protein RecT [Fictibacillus gelatini]|uniref:recombination protein RecT n=1 Tax=Fictibacillus gelatini TaxID=225985 RepID=UPI000408632B|nr:recombination protein RecT [Fictibacillus gelatini]
MATNQQLKNQLANRKNGGNAPAASPAQTIAAYLKKMAPEIEKALPSHMNPDRLARIALTTIRTNPTLLECTVPSLMGAVMQSAQLGLEPGLIGHCYFVPFNNKKKGPDGREYWEKDVQFIIGYKGMIDLARRSGQIQNIYAYTVHENDEFEYALGLHPKLEHKPATGNRGKMTHAYAVAHFKDGGYQFEVMDVEEIEKRKKRSKASKNGPWVTDYEEMAKKTVIRHMWKYLPISIEIQEQAAQDEVVRKDITADPEPVEIIDVTPPFEEEDQPDQQKEETTPPPNDIGEPDPTDEELNNLFNQG